MCSAFIVFELALALFIIAWMYFIGVFDKWPEIVDKKRRAERIVREETERGYHGCNIRR